MKKVEKPPNQVKTKEENYNSVLSYFWKYTLSLSERNFFILRNENRKKISYGRKSKEIRGSNFFRVFASADGISLLATLLFIIQHLSFD